MSKGEEQIPEWWKKQVSASRVFFLGAGFSAAAGIPMTPQLFAEAMRLFRLDAYPLYDVVEGYARTCFGLDTEEPQYASLNLSEFCTYLHYVELGEFGGPERWSNEGSRENLALRYYLSKAITNLTPTGNGIPELYLRFARQLVHSDVVVSFNWDCLLERALEAIGKEYMYMWAEDSADKIWIQKLHGSVNWCWGEHRHEDHHWQPLGLTEYYPGTEVYHSEELLDVSAWQAHPPIGDLRPFIILPGFGKAFDVRLLAALWYRPEAMFSATHHVYVVGLSLTRDDFIIRSLFLDTLPYISDLTGEGERKVIVMNPDPEVRDNYSFLLGVPHASFLCEKFCERHVKIMEGQVPDGND